MSRRAQVLAALRAAEGRSVSGEALADLLGVSRMTVSKHVSRLRERGYEISATPGSGYRLVSALDALDAEEVASGVGSPQVGLVVGGGVTGSTNDDARRLAVGGIPEIAVALASGQTAGRGRLGRTWESPKGGVYASFVFRPALAIASLTPLPLVVGLGAARGLARLGVDASLKWPNDVMLGEGKLAGVLLEMTAESDLAAWVVAGIGMNVRAPGSRSQDFASAYLDDVREGIALNDVAVALIDGVSDAYATFVESGFAGLAPEYQARHVLAYREVAVRDPRGRLIAQGRVAGVDELGRLLVESLAGVEAVVAGDVTLRSA